MDELKRNLEEVVGMMLEDGEHSLRAEGRSSRMSGTLWIGSRENWAAIPNGISIHALEPERRGTVLERRALPVRLFHDRSSLDDFDESIRRRVDGEPRVQRDEPP